MRRVANTTKHRSVRLYECVCGEPEHNFSTSEVSFVVTEPACVQASCPTHSRSVRVNCYQMDAGFASIEHAAETLL